MFYIANEGLSILENAGRIGLPMPEALKKIHKDIEQFASSEQLTAHANSIAVRFENEN